MSIRESIGKFFPSKEKEASKQMKGAELKAALAEASATAGMKPETVDKFLKFEDPGDPVNFVKAGGILLLAHLAVLAAVNLGVGEQYDQYLQLPNFWHEMLQAVHNLTVNSAASNSFRHHFPFLVLEIGAFVGGGTLAEISKKLKKRTRKALEVKSTLENKKDKGEINFQMPWGHTAIFPGAGDPYDVWLKKFLGISDSMTYTTNPDNNISLTKQGYELSHTSDTLDEALERGDFAKAGEVVVLPVTERDQFLPDPVEKNGGFDMKLSEIEVMIAKMEEFLSKKDGERTAKQQELENTSRFQKIRNKLKNLLRGNKGDGEEELRSLKKKFIVVSSAQQKETNNTGREKTVATRTLEDLRKEENSRRKYLEVEIVDPTELVFKALIPLLDGKTPDLNASEESTERYSSRFYEMFDDLVDKGQAFASGEKARVFYNVSDISTASNVRRADDIAIVSTEAHKQIMLDSGIQENRIIVISKLVKNEIERLVKPKKDDEKVQT